jgi:glucose/arabinose dehydrogenase
MPVPDCSQTADESVSFYVADTPFGFDFEPGRWVSPWNHRLFVALHGQFGTWIGARIVTIGIDAVTGLLISGGTYAPDGGQMNTGSAVDFAIGWDDRKLDHGRPSDVTFASDGRMFVSQDVGPDSLGMLGMVLWFAPLDLPKL